MSALRIGLTQRVEDLADRGERRDALDQAWTPWIAALGAVAVPLPNRLDDPVGFVRDLGLDGIVFTGGNDLADLDGARNVAPERDATEVALLADASETSLPVFAVCRGMQMLVQFWGGTLRRLDGHVGRHHDLQIGPGGSGLRSGPVNSFHQWGVDPDGVGPALEVLALAPDGTVEAVKHPGLPQVGVMWHPERANPDPLDQALFRSLLDGRVG